MKYKDTPFGRIPEDWDVLPINEITSLVTDYVANGSFASLAENVKYKEEKDVAVLIRLVDFNRSFEGDFVYIDEHAYEFLSKSKLYGGEIIISNVGANVGTVFRCPHLPCKMSLAPNSIMVKFNENDEFYYYWLKSPFGQHMLKSIVTGSAQPKFNKTNFRDMVAPVPPISVQDKIAEILRSIDDKIKLNNEINKNLQEQAQSIFRNMFLSEEVTIPATIADISLNVTDGVHNTVHDDPNGEYLLLSCKNIKGGFLSVGSSERTISKDVFEKLRKRTRLAKGDILISSVGTVGELLLLNEEPKNFEFQRSVAMVKPNPTIVSPYYVYESLIAQRKELINAAHGAVQQCIFIADIAGFPIGIPSKHSLDEFDAIVKPMFDIITAKQEEAERLSVLRDTLLPKLMSGELDVSDIDI